MKKKKLPVLVLAALVFLTACQAEPPQSGSRFPVEESSLSPSPPVLSRPEPEGPETAAPSVYFPVFEYHNDLREEGVPDTCRVVIPRLEAFPREDQKAPDLTRANAPLEELRELWEDFRDSRDHEDGSAVMEVDSFPFTNGRWVQVLVRAYQFPGYFEEYLFSANFDRETGCVVTAEEYLAQMNLTGRGLLDEVNRRDIPALLGWEKETEGKAVKLAVQGFRGREDGSAVFFARVWFSVREEDGTDGWRQDFLAYDTREGEFLPWREGLERGTERPNTISLHYGWEDYPGRQPEEYPLEPRPAPPGEVRVEFSLREYHDLNCMAELPRLRGERDGEEIPGLQEANAPFQELAWEWKEYRASPEHGNTAEKHRESSLLIQTYPYSDNRWAQAVVRVSRVRDGEWDGDRVVSVNWNREEQRAVSPEEMLGRLGLTREELLTRLGEVDGLSRSVYHDPYSILTPRTLAVRAFRGREDGSVVFYLEMECEKQRLNDQREVTATETTVCYMAYDTRDGGFRNVVEDLLRKWETVELPQTDDPPLRWQAEVQSPML